MPNTGLNMHTIFCELDSIFKEICDKINTIADQIQILAESKTTFERQLFTAQCQLHQLLEKHNIKDFDKPNDTILGIQNTHEATDQPDKPTPISQSETELKNGLNSLIETSNNTRLKHIISAEQSDRGPRIDINSKASCCTEKHTQQSTNSTNVKDVLNHGQMDLQKEIHTCPFSNTVTHRTLKTGVEKKDLAIHTMLKDNASKDIPASHSPYDPIFAAFYAEKSPLSVPASTKCPIRFLNQHPPEKIAQYLETHKHEIPRSHAICVKRQQKNEKHVRNLDAKYGSLANIIQGLGQKHKSLLPEEDEGIEKEQFAGKGIEIWAQNVSTDGTEQEVEEHHLHHNNLREPYFDRPLKEIRVGESPSRPWGFSVPVFDNLEEKNQIPPPASESAGFAFGLSGSATLKINQSVELDKASSSQKVPATVHSQYPTEWDKIRSSSGQEQPGIELPSPRTSKPAEKISPNNPLTNSRGQLNFFPTSKANIPEETGQPSMIFTGPVLIGYSVDQAISFVQQVNG